MNLDFNSILSYLISPELQRTLFPLKVFSIFVTLFLVIAIVLILFKTQYLKLSFTQDWKDFLDYHTRANKKMERFWAKIMKRLETDSESEHKLAILEADEILDDTLEKMGFTGDTLKEKLEKIPSEVMPSLKQLNDARKIRDNILHDPDFRLSSEQSRKVLEAYEQAFRELEVL